MINKAIFLAIGFIILLNLAGCTQAGLSAGLLGRWKSSKVTVDGQDMSSTMTVEIEFRNDDSFKKTVVVTSGVTSIATTVYGQVVNCAPLKKTVTVKNDKDDSESSYIYELLFDKLKIEYSEQNSVVEAELQKDR